MNVFPVFQLTSVKAELSTSTMLLGNPLKLQSKPQVSEHSHTGFSRTSDQRFAFGMSGFAEIGREDSNDRELFSHQHWQKQSQRPEVQ